MAQDPAAARRILPQQGQQQAQPSSQMGSFSAYAPHQQREIQKNYVFVDEHNRHKRLKVMRACEGCRRRKIKCDAATTNTWPCSACMRLKLHCVRPNGFDGAADPTGYDMGLDPSGQFQQIPMAPHMMHDPAKAGQPMFNTHGGYADMSAPSIYQTVPLEATQNMQSQYVTTQPDMSMLNQAYPRQDVFSAPPSQPQHHTQQTPQQQTQQQTQQQAQQQTQPQRQPPGSRGDQASPEAYSPDSFSQNDLSDLLGTLKVDETGAAPYIRNKASFRHEESPAVEEEDDYGSVLPPMPVGPGLKIRIPPPLMPDDETANRYIDLYFVHVHPYVPVLSRPQFYRQWQTDRDSISPLILEAIFAMGARLAEEPGEGQQWIALASRHADSFMDIPRLSTLQALLMILKAREAAPKRGYYYRSWMMVVQCVQMAKDLGLDEHFDDHELGRGCNAPAEDCQLRTRIWQTTFVCEVMVGTPQGRHDLAVDIDTVDFNIPRHIPGGDEAEYHTSRNFVYFARIVRNVGNLSNVYLKLMKLRRLKEWGIEPEVQQLSHDFGSFMAEIPSDLTVSFPPDGSPPWLPTAFLGNLHSYYYLSLILFHRPQLSFLNPSTSDGQWKHHMTRCYSSAKSLCRLQESIIDNFGMAGLQCMQRGFSFTVYAGLSCIVLHIVAIVSPDPDLNTDAREFFTRHMRVMEKVMDVWGMPELQKQIDTVRVAFSADVRKPFVLKPSFPYGSPHSPGQSPPSQSNQGYRPMDGAAQVGQGMNQQNAQQQVFYANQPLTPPVSAGAMGSKSNSPSSQSMVMMTQGGQPQAMHQMSLNDAPAWNPARIFEQWNTTFGATSYSSMTPQTATIPVPTSSHSGSQDLTNVPDVQAVNAMSNAQQISPQQYAAAAPSNTFMTPAMWQESVASVYEGGLKRSWDYDGNHVMKRH